MNSPDPSMFHAERPGPWLVREGEEKSEQQSQARAAAVQPQQPTDYSVQWAEYYRSLGMFREADVIMKNHENQNKGQPQPQLGAAGQPQYGAVQYGQQQPQYCRVRDELFASSRPDDKEAVVYGNARNGELSSNEAKLEKLTIQEEREALKKRLVEIDVNELKELERLLEEKRADLKKVKNHFREKLELAFAAVESLQFEEAVKCSEIEEAIVDLAAKISNNKERQPDMSIKSCLECPICLEICKPPTQVWQCPEGHILCGSCSAKPEVQVCPQCRVGLAGRLSRGRVLEEMARKIFSTN